MILELKYTIDSVEHIISHSFNAFDYPNAFFVDKGSPVSMGEFASPVIEDADSPEFEVLKVSIHSIHDVSVVCNNCNFMGEEDDLEFFLEDKDNMESGFKGCPNCEADDYLMDKTPADYLSQVSGEMVLNAYNKLYGVESVPFDYTDISGNHHMWWMEVYNQLENRKKANLSLNKVNYLGKVTRSLLHVLGLEEPKTLGSLIARLWDVIPEVSPKVEISRYGFEDINTAKKWVNYHSTELAEWGFEPTKQINDLFYAIEVAYQREYNLDEGNWGVADGNSIK